VKLTTTRLKKIIVEEMNNLVFEEADDPLVHAIAKLETIANLIIQNEEAFNMLIEVIDNLREISPSPGSDIAIARGDM
jgi:hypothetical protein